MNRLVTLTTKETDTLQEVLEYITSEDDRERNDFEGRATDLGVVPDTLFNEHDILLTDEVPKVLQSHIFYKASVLLNALLPEVYGG